MNPTAKTALDILRELELKHTGDARESAFLWRALQMVNDRAQQQQAEIERLRAALAVVPAQLKAVYDDYADQVGEHAVDLAYDLGLIQQAIELALGDETPAENYLPR